MIQDDLCCTTTGISLDKDGYPRVKWKNRLWRLHRLIFTFTNGVIPTDKVIGHKCNNKGCINPNHLYLTTAQQNSTDAAKDGLYVTGLNHPRFKKAVETSAAYQRYINGESQQIIADSLGISQSALSARFIRYKKENILEC